MLNSENENFWIINFVFSLIYVIKYSFCSLWMNPNNRNENEMIVLFKINFDEFVLYLF